MTNEQLLRKLVPIRREIHQHPELGNQEFKTAALIERILKGLKIPFKRVAKTGVVAAIGKSNGRCVALRADMDALPLTEKNQKSYRSKIPGVMHACGHDAHVTMLLGAAMLLSDRRDFNGTVKFLFQPNEEGAGGAKSLINGNAMKNPKVDAVFGLHVNPRLPSGTVGLKEGPLMASVDKFAVEVMGAGGHAAYPHEGKDAIPIASEIVQSLQTIVSRKVDPVEPAVVTVGTISGGTRYNILAEKVILTGTVRTLSEKIHKQMPRWIREIVAGVCRSHGVKFQLNYDVLGSVLSNSKSMTDLSRQVAMDLFGKQRIIELNTATMGGEDFAEYLRFAPGCFIYIGTGNASLKSIRPWHHPEFEIDESALPVGSRLLDAIAREFLR